MRLKAIKNRAKRALQKATRRALKRSKKSLREARRAVVSTVKSTRIALKKYKDRDKGCAKRLREIQRFNRTRVQVGILSSGRGAASNGSADGKLSGLSVLEVGTFHEFGLGVPRRSFIRDWYSENQEPSAKRLRVCAELVVSGKRSAVGAAELLGLWAQGSIQARITAGPSDWAPLAASTIKRKGYQSPTFKDGTVARVTPSAKALIDTGQLRSSITFTVETLKK